MSKITRRKALGIIVMAGMLSLWCGESRGADVTSNPVLHTIAQLHMAQLSQAANCGPRPPLDACGKLWVCTSEREWEEIPVPAGRACDGGVGHCDGVDVDCVCPNTDPGYIFPRYIVLGLIYAPPGCTSTPTASCAGQGSVDYSANSSMGTEVSTTSSFAVDVNNSVDLSIGGDGIGSFGFGASGGFTNTSTSSHSQTITKGQSLELKSSGTGDGIDHNQDKFILLLNPAVAVTQARTDNHNACVPILIANWYIGVSNPSGTQTLFPLTVEEAKNPASNVAGQQLQSLGFTPNDFAAILSLDPFASGATTIDNTRYVPTIYNFGYTPDPSCTGGKVCGCLSLSENIKNEFQTKAGTTASLSYNVGFSEKLSGIDIGIFKFGATGSQKFTWTNSSTNTNTTDSSQSATATVQCPSLGYSGPVEMNIYWDTLFGSFLFVPTTLSRQLVIQRGQIINVSGNPERHIPVKLSYRGKVFHTYTDNAGNYVVYAIPEIQPLPGAPAPIGILSVKNKKQPVTIGPTAEAAVVHVP